MKWLTFEIKRTPGFRFNLMDLCIIAGLAGLSALIRLVFPLDYMYLLPLYVGLTFFLFCNVFRIGTRLEYIWFFTFILTAGFGLFSPDRLWFWVLVVCESLKAVLILYRIIRGPYVGVFSRMPPGEKVE